MNRLDAEVDSGLSQQTFMNPLAYDPKNGGGGGRNRYKYHDRGDGMYDDARKLGQQPHLVTTGQCVSFLSTFCTS